MKTIQIKYLLSTGVAITIAMSAWLSQNALAADEPMKPMKGGEHQSMVTSDPASKTNTGGKMMKDGKMTEHCQALMEQKSKMHADIKTQNAELSKQLAEMNRAPEDKKLGLMAAILTQMVEQRVALDARKSKMEEQMMQHMMQHMEMGKEGMVQCPMMKSSASKPMGAHKDHQTETK